MEEVFESIAKRIITKEDLIFFLGEINLLENFIFKNLHLHLFEKAKGKVNEELRNCLQEWEREGLIPSIPFQQLAFFEKLKKNLQELPQIRLEIAFSPSQEFLLRLREGFKKNLNQAVVLDIILNPQLVGGVIMEYQGKYINFSLAKKIDELISQKLL